MKCYMSNVNPYLCQMAIKKITRNSLWIFRFGLLTSFLLLITKRIKKKYMYRMPHEQTAEILQILLTYFPSIVVVVIILSWSSSGYHSCSTNDTIRFKIAYLERKKRKGLMLTRKTSFCLFYLLQIVRESHFNDILAAACLLLITLYLKLP